MSRAPTQLACRAALMLLPVLALGPAGSGGELHAQAVGASERAAERPLSRVFESAIGVEGRVGGVQASASQPLLQEPAVTPRGAFIRSLLVPGWGHAAADAHGRAAFYVAAQGSTYWMLAKSLTRRRNAARFRDAEFDRVTAELRASGMVNPDSIRLAAEGDARVERWDELVGIRGDQVEDWLALGIFLTLLGATDALVAAHMADFPEPLTIRVTPATAPGRGWGLGLSLPFDRRRSSGR